MTRGGKRKGAGRKSGPCGPKTIRYTIRFAGAEWLRIKQAAASLNMSIADYIRLRLLD